MAGLISGDELNQDILFIRQMIICLSIAMVAAIVIASWYFSRQLTRPLIQLKHSIKEVQRGNFNVKMKPKAASNELDIVNNAFIEMSRHIETLIEQIAKVQIKQKEAEFNHLKSQIRPHFLYNTLESVRALAEVREHYEIAEVASSLGNLLRYSIDSHARFVTIGSELRQAQNYMKIQRICSQYPVYVEMDIGEHVLQSYTIPLLFQPIIENSIRHGFDGMERAAKIMISARSIHEDLLIEISDNGKGMPHEEVEQLNWALTETEQDPASATRSGIGLVNVASRIQLVFGDPYGMAVSSEPDEGTTILMRLPWITDSSKHKVYFFYKERSD